MLGYIYGLLYIFSISISTIWVDSLGKNFSALLMLLITTLVAIFSFNLFNIKNLKSSHLTIKKSPLSWFLFSAAMASSWFFTYYSVVHGSARLLIIIFFLANALGASILDRNIIKQLACIITILLTGYFSPEASVINVITSILAGLSGFIYWKVSSDFAKQNKLTTVALLSIRFYILLAIIIMLSPFYYNEILSLNLYDILILVLLGFINMVLPNFVSQASVHAIGPIKFGFLTSSLPMITVLLQAICMGTWSFKLFIIASVASCILNVDFAIRYIKKKML